MGILAKQLKRLVRENAPRDATYARRLAFCPRVEADLAQLGFGVRSARNLRAAHLWALVRLWSLAMSAASVRNLVSLFGQLHAWSGSANRLPSTEELGLRPGAGRSGRS